MRVRVGKGRSVSRMSKSKKSKMPSEAKATKLMPLFCFEVLDHALQGKSHPKYPKELGVEPSCVEEGGKERDERKVEFERARVS